MEEGAVPIGIVFADDVVQEEALALCDGFVIPGGKKIRPCHFDVIDYALEHGRPLLGTCLGMQAIAIHFIKKRYGHKQILARIEGPINHWPMVPTRSDPDLLSHEVQITDRSSILYEVFQTDTLQVNSLHHYGITEVAEDTRIVARAPDGMIEAIEYRVSGSFLLGVQWHPELMAGMSPLWQRFLAACVAG